MNKISSGLNKSEEKTDFLKKTNIFDEAIAKKLRVL